jgi:polar amino acid transport system permease protein
MRAGDSSRRSGTERRGRLTRIVVTVAILGGIALFLVAAPAYRWEWSRIWAYRGLFLEGLVTTAWMSLAALVLGLVLGFAGGFARISRRPAVNQVATVYVELIRGTPLLVQLFVAYYCVAPGIAAGLRRIDASPGLVDLVQSPGVVGVIALGVFSGAYVTEIVRAAIQSVDRGQTEAALSQGMSRSQVMRHVLLPQALRRMVPPLTGELVNLVKDSSLLYAITVTELTKRTYEVYSATQKTFEPFLVLALLYLAITFPLGRLSRRLELARPS